jgi:hypothetical protein
MAEKTATWVTADGPTVTISDSDSEKEGRGISLWIEEADKPSVHATLTVLEAWEMERTLRLFRQSRLGRIGQET